MQNCWCVKLASVEPEMQGGGAGFQQCACGYIWCSPAVRKGLSGARRSTACTHACSSRVVKLATCTNTYIYKGSPLVNSRNVAWIYSIYSLGAMVTQNGCQCTPTFRKPGRTNVLCYREEGSLRRECLKGSSPSKRPMWTSWEGAASIWCMFWNWWDSTRYRVQIAN